MTYFPHLFMPSTVTPPYEMELDALLAVFQQHYGESLRHFDKIVSIFKNAGVGKRYLCETPETLVNLQDFPERNQRYQAAMKKYVVEAAQQALENAGRVAKDIDYIVLSSCTGHMIPGADIHLIQELGFRPDVKRLPVNQIGCAGGLYGVAHARDFCLPRPDTHALVIAAEFGSYAFVPTDLSMSAMVGIALFGDGAAATVIGPPTDRPSLKLTSQKNLIVPNSERFLAFDLEHDGFRVIIDRAIAKAMGEVVGPHIEQFLQDSQQPARDLRFWGIHPGGQKIIGGVRDAFSLSDDDLAQSWNTLKSVGNLSSASILFVIKALLEEKELDEGTPGLLAAFGPGFNIELMLAEWG